MATILSKPDQILKARLEDMNAASSTSPKNSGPGSLGMPSPKSSSGKEDPPQKESKKLGKIIIKAESPADGNNDLILEVEATIKSLKGWFPCCRGEDHPYLLIERARIPPPVDVVPN